MSFLQKVKSHRVTAVEFQAFPLFHSYKASQGRKYLNSSIFCSTFTYLFMLWILLSTEPYGKLDVSLKKMRKCKETQIEYQC